MIFFVTGGAGFIGEVFSKKLLDKYGSEDNEFIFLVRKSPMNFLDGYKGIKGKIRVVKGDISDIESIENIFKKNKIDCVFHIASQIDYGRLKTKNYYKNNLDGAENIFKLSLKNKVKKVVYLSTAAVYHPTYDNFVDEEYPLSKKFTTRYTHSKYLAYNIALQYKDLGLPIVSLLPVSVFGERSPLFGPIIKNIIKNKIIFIPKVKSRMSLVYVGDLADSMIKAFEKGKEGESYLISGQHLALRKIVLKSAEILNKEIKLLEIPSPLFTFLMFLSGLASRITRIEFFYNIELFNFIKGGLVAKHDKAIKEIGHKETDIDENLAKMVESFK